MNALNKLVRIVFFYSGELTVWFVFPVRRSVIPNRVMAMVGTTERVAAQGTAKSHEEGHDGKVKHIHHTSHTREMINGWAETTVSPVRSPLWSTPITAGSFRCCLLTKTPHQCVCQLSAKPFSEQNSIVEAAELPELLIGGLNFLLSVCHNDSLFFQEATIFLFHTPEAANVLDYDREIQ